MVAGAGPNMSKRRKTKVSDTETLAGSAGIRTVNALLKTVRPARRSQCGERWVVTIKRHE
jgi:hypothetical protein